MFSDASVSTDKRALAGVIMSRSSDAIQRRTRQVAHSFFFFFIKDFIYYYAANEKVKPRTAIVFLVLYLISSHKEIKFI